MCSSTVGDTGKRTVKMLVEYVIAISDFSVLLNFSHTKKTNKSECQCLYAGDLGF